MIKVKKGEKYSLYFDTNIELIGASVTYEILNFKNEVIKNGIGYVIGKNKLRTEIIDFNDLPEGIYNINVNISIQNEQKTIYEWLLVEE